MAQRMLEEPELTQDELESTDEVERANASGADDAGRSPKRSRCGDGGVEGVQAEGSGRQYSGARQCPKGPTKRRGGGSRLASIEEGKWKAMLKCFEEQRKYINELIPFLAMKDCKYEIAPKMLAWYKRRAEELYEQKSEMDLTMNLIKTHFNF
jgi:hypothetical protein